MRPPKYIDGPNSVQTSLYGYDRHKTVQVNNLRGKPIVVLRSESTENGCDKRKIDVRVNGQNPKPNYPSYTHFHHQYSCPKQNHQQTFVPHNSTTTDRIIQNRSQQPKFNQQYSDSFSSCDSRINNDQQNVKRLFDKLAVTCSNSPSTSTYSNISSDITILELKSGFSSTAPRNIQSVDEFNSSEVTSSSASSYVSAQSNQEDFSPISPPETVSPAPSSMNEPTSDTDCSRCNDDSDDLISQPSCDEEHVLALEPAKKVHTCADEGHCLVFNGGNCVDDVKERNEMLFWYNDLIQWRHDVLTKKRFGPPRCNPRPLTVTMIGASRAQRANPFQRVGEIHPFAMEMIDHARNRMEAKRSQKLIPFDLPLPAPHEFMANAKRMEPHLFIEYCYQLTAAAYIDIGLNPPNRRPPIPPMIEPFVTLSSRESICSSASDFSSDGEYSDDSEETKKERHREKMERHSRRESRLQQIFKRRQTEDSLMKKAWDNAVY